MRKERMERDFPLLVAGEGAPERRAHDMSHLAEQYDAGWLRPSGPLQLPFLAQGTCRDPRLAPVGEVGGQVGAIGVDQRLLTKEGVELAQQAQVVALAGLRHAPRLQRRREVIGNRHGTYE